MVGKENVVFFITSLQSGGIENYLLRFLKKYHNGFNRIIIYCKGGIGGQLEKSYREISNVEIVKKKVGFFNLLGFYRIGAFLKREKTDAVCDFTGNFSGFILLTAKVFGVGKRIVFYRSSEDRFAKNYFKSIYNNFMKKMVLRCATDILSNSIAAFDYFYPEIWNTDSRFDVIYNGIDASQFLSNYSHLRSQLSIPDNAFVIGHTGRFNPAKNHQTILKVAERVVKAYDDIYFIMCGNDVKSNLESTIVEKGLENKIMVFNNRNDIVSFLSTMDCYYFPSLTEGQPNALIEAMVAGLPIVASNIAPIRETVPEVLHPYLVPPLDEELAVERLLQIYNQPLHFDVQSWAIKYFDSDKLFQQFYKRF